MVLTRRRHIQFQVAGVVGYFADLDRAGSERGVEQPLPATPFGQAQPQHLRRHPAKRARQTGHEPAELPASAGSAELAQVGDGVGQHDRDEHRAGPVHIDGHQRNFRQRQVGPLNEQGMFVVGDRLRQFRR